jgi:hypothetical protein
MLELEKRAALEKILCTMLNVEPTERISVGEVVRMFTPDPPHMAAG